MEPSVLEIKESRFKDLLRQKWRLFNQNLDTKHWEIAKQCLINQSKYIEENKFNVISLVYENKFYIFLEINANNFSSNDEKKQFLKEVNFLRLIDFQLQRESPLGIERFLSNNTEGKGDLFITQVFITKRE